MPSRLTFQLLRSNAARAQALARTLAGSGLPTVAILAPATPSGQNMTRAFLDALADKNGRSAAAGAVQVTEQLTFADNATTFTAQAKKLLAAAPAALYVPASATQLELIAAQLAASGVLPIYKVTRGTADNPGLASPPVQLLLSSAEGMGERLLKNAGRYLQGAVLAPLSAGRLAVADNAPSTPTARWDGYTEQVGAEPGALDALGYDAVLALRTACARLHAQSPTARCAGETLAGSLRSLTLQGATGPITFDDSGERSGPVLLLRVEGTALKSVSEPIHAHARTRPARL
jgi:ABC-type branched-subunit amino acid transport system substrate-binding protein